MRGQAFVTFPSVEDAVAALAAVNGFVFKEGKPLIIHYGRGENKRGNDQSGGDHSEE
jgi:RNA recognition motif-containing protein